MAKVPIPKVPIPVVSFTHTVVVMQDSKQLLSLWGTRHSGYPQVWGLIKLENTDFLKVQYSSPQQSWSFLSNSPDEILQMAEGPWIEKLKESIFWKHFLEDKGG